MRFPHAKSRNFSTTLLLPLFLLFLSYPLAESQQPGIPPEMVFVPEGYITRGSHSSEFADEKPSHQVYLDAFYMDRLEVSNAEYLKFVKATGYKAPKFNHDERFNHPAHPVVGVSWYDAMAYAKWTGKRLPTEAEWEKAAKGDSERVWPWGNNWEPSLRFYYLNIMGKSDNFEYSAPVDYYKDGVSPYGIYNMAGNVWEWCFDWYDKNYYNHSPEINPQGPAKGKRKVLRGGSWSNKIENARVAKRTRNYPHVTLDSYGFRCVKDAND